MNRENFKKEKKIIFFYCVLYSLICEVISLFVLGFNMGFLIGIWSGSLGAVVNLYLLELVVDTAIINKNMTLAFLIQVGRLLIYGAVGFGCYLISLPALVAYAIGVLGIVLATVITYGKEETNG